MRHTSRGCWLSSRRNASVAPRASSEAARFISGPLVSGCTGEPSTNARNRCCAVRCAAWNRIEPPSGVHTRRPPASPPTDSSNEAVRFRTGPPAAGTMQRKSFVYHSSPLPSCDWKAIHRPSGDHDGVASGPLSVTSGAAVPPAAAMT